MSSYNNNTSKDIKYINKDFNSFKEALMDYAKTYFPNTYNDFSPADPGTMFIDMASYVGDVLSYYQENQIQENFLQYAKEKNNLLTLSYMFGYKPKVTTAANADVEVFQLLPSKDDGFGNFIPDYDYALILNENAVISSTLNDKKFITLDKVDFSFSSSFNPTEVSVYQINNITNNAEYFLLKKEVKAISGEIKTKDVDFGNAERFPSHTITDTDIIKVLDVVDSDGNNWFETPYLAQETIFDEIRNIEANDQSMAQYNDTTPYLLRLRRVPRRFITRFTSDDSMVVDFGSGLSNSFAKLDQTLPQSADETITPNPNNVGLGLPDGLSKLDESFDPSNFLYTNSYGIAPNNTTLTIRYIVGGGVESNVPSNTLNTFDTINIESKVDGLSTTLLTQIKNTLAVNNPKAAVGGEDGDSLEELRLNSMANFASQKRAVTKDDYIVRAMSLPARFGSVSKVYIEQDKALNINENDSIIDNNPLALSLYVLGYNENKRLALPNQALKENLKNFLGQYRMLTDAVSIKDAFYINISVNFNITVLPGNNSNIVLNGCITAVKNYFDIDKWQINQPIIISDLINVISGINGVQNVIDIDFGNLSGGVYSPYGYDTKMALRNNVLYPSLDPSIFEIRFPNTDIQGRVVNY
ncbi:baseplate J/gp47 family protein [bacterium]|nr:baseplate J/gp47 family protein [bacterium]